MFFPLYDDNPTRSTPVVTIALIVTNVLVFFHQVSLGDELGQAFIFAAGLLPSRFMGGEVPMGVDYLPVPATFVSHMFLHGGWMHLLGNMWILWIFGDNVEDRFGHLKFLLLYLGWGFVAAASQVMLDGQHHIPMVGASGAIAGVLGSYAVLYPKAKVHTLVVLVVFITRFGMPAFIYLGIWFGIQFMSLAEQGVAWWAHIGGFVGGFTLAVLSLITRGRG